MELSEGRRNCMGFSYVGISPLILCWWFGARMQGIDGKRMSSQEVMQAHLKERESVNHQIQLKTVKPK